MLKFALKKVCELFVGLFAVEPTSFLLFPFSIQQFCFGLIQGVEIPKRFFIFPEIAKLFFFADLLPNTSVCLFFFSCLFKHFYSLSLVLLFPSSNQTFVALSLNRNRVFHYHICFWTKACSCRA